MRTCSNCLKELPLSSFKKTKNYYMRVCRSCYYIKYTKPYRQSKRIPKISLSKDQIKDRNKESKKRYRLNNSEKIAEYRRKYREKNKNNPIFKAQRNIRKRLKKQLDKGFKIGQTSEMLGCTLVYFKTYIESQFTDEMSWDNYGIYWHIDHIKPICSFNLTHPDIAKQVNHYTNLRPLKAEDNIRKSQEDNKLKYVTHRS